jgi:hypothetical protein
VQNAKAGKNLKPYVSTNITDADYPDLLFYDWGVYHFHLGLGPDKRRKGFIGRTNDLLFAVTDPAATIMYLLDVLPHSFTNQRLLQIIEENWPNLLERYTLKGVLGLEHNASDEEIHKLRRAGVCVLVQTPSGRVLAPMGGGISTARTSIRNTMSTDWAKKVVRDIEVMILNGRAGIEKYFQSKHRKAWNDLEFKLTGFGQSVQVVEMTTQTLVLEQSLVRK